MLEWTQTYFTSLSDEPCSGADLFAPADSEANPRCSADSRAGPPLPFGLWAALDGSGAVLRTSAVLEADP
jgi:hypothetical protein